jgi:DNA-binding transcriptional ArsR family regulator
MAGSITGQAGVFRVASELLLRGHIPAFPTVDDGVDIVLDNGLRIQVKARRLMVRRGYPQGVYFFCSRDRKLHASTNRKARGRSSTRTLSEVCDFFVYFGIDEERFFVIPADKVPPAFYVPPVGIEMRRKAPLELIASLREKGMSLRQIASEIGIDPATVTRHLKRYNSKDDPKGSLYLSAGNRYFATFENGWEQLNVSHALEAIEVASAEMREG